MREHLLWAQKVPNAPYPMTVAELAALPDDGFFYELVEGRLIRIPGSGSKATRIAVRLIIALGSFVQRHNLGDVTGPDGEFDLTQPDDATETALIPDVAFVLAGRLPAIDSAAADAIPRIVPDLVAEVASPNQYRPEMAAKARLYLERGVRLVWVIWPGRQEVDVWIPTTPDAPVMTLGVADNLDGHDVLLGFTCPIVYLLK